MYKTERLAQFVLIAIFAGVSCSEVTSPKTVDLPGTVAAPGPAANAFVWVMVVERGGLCIEGATVRVMLGQRAGETVAMKTPCDAWSYDGGYFFDGLTRGEMTLEASAPGHETQVKKVVAAPGPHGSFEFVLSRK